MPHYLTASELREQFQSEGLSAVDLVSHLERRIETLDWSGPEVRSVIELNPDAAQIASGLDAERREGRERSPLHGVPVLIKDNLDTADSMRTTAGSLALMDSTPTQDATVVKRLREAGAVILGKTNMSEWANFRGNGSSSGWSGRGGLTRNPHSLDRTASGSSSGSAAAVAAGLAPIAIGTETDGSVISPASACGVVGYKPTLGLTSRAGVIPIANSQDTVGVFARSVQDIAITLNAIVGVDDRDPVTKGCSRFVDIDFTAELSANGLAGLRLGTPENGGLRGYSAAAERVFDTCLSRLDELGANIVTDCNFDTADELAEKPGELERLLWEFRRDLNAYLKERNDPAFRNLADIIAFNEANSEKELLWFGQELLELAEASADVTDDQLRKLNDRLNRLSRQEGIDAVLEEHKLDAIIAPSKSPAATIDLVNGEKLLGGSTWIAAIAGYPIVTVPAGFVHGLPVGISFIGTAWSDHKLLQMAYAWEQNTQMLREPTFVYDICSAPNTRPFELA